jgi:hypothetical protein
VWSLCAWKASPIKVIWTETQCIQIRRTERQWIFTAATRFPAVSFVWQLTRTIRAQSFSGADSHSAGLEISRLLQNPKVHYRVHISPPLVPILSRIKPVHTFLACFTNIHSNILILRAASSLQVFFFFPMAFYSPLQTYAFLNGLLDPIDIW